MSCRAAVSRRRGRLATGDLVWADPEGYLTLVDRDYDVIKSGGEWISSVELENTKMAHDAVNEATVVGVEHERYQERLLGFVVTASGAEIDHDTPPRGVTRPHPSGLSKWWTPDEIRFVDTIPKTANGKFDRASLREAHEGHAIGTSFSPDE